MVNSATNNLYSSSDALSAVINRAASPLINRASSSPEQQQASAIVSISRQAQALNSASQLAVQSKPVQASNSAPYNPAAEGRETGPQEAAEKPGIQLLEGESRGGRINTYA